MHSRPTSLAFNVRDVQSTAKLIFCAGHCFTLQSVMNDLGLVHPSHKAPEIYRYKSLPFICAQRFKLQTKTQPFHVSLFVLNFCSFDAVYILMTFWIDFMLILGSVLVPETSPQLVQNIQKTSILEP